MILRLNCVRVLELRKCWYAIEATDSQYLPSLSKRNPCGFCFFHDSTNYLLVLWKCFSYFVISHEVFVLMVDCCIVAGKSHPPKQVNFLAVSDLDLYQARILLIAEEDVHVGQFREIRSVLWGVMVEMTKDESYCTYVSLERGGNVAPLPSGWVFGTHKRFFEFLQC